MFLDKEINPGSEIKTNAQLDAYIRSNVESAYHPCGTCRMGSDNDSVVDDVLQVRGVENLRIVDASVMPDIISGNIHAPVLMIAERAADFIKDVA